MSSPRPVTTRRARPVFDGPTYTAPRYHSRIWGPLIFFLLVVVLTGVIGVGGGLYWALHRAQGSSQRTVTVRVAQGDSVNAVADHLNARGIINSTLLFKLDARIQGLAGKLRVGDYQVRRNMSIDEMVAALTVYHPVLVHVTVPEGYRTEQIALRLQAQGIDARSFTSEAQHPNQAFLQSSILASKPGGASLEGYLSPNTYDVQAHSSGREFARLMVQQRDKEFTAPMRVQARLDGMSIYQVLTLASIVEREARVPDERRTIASVYLNRLHIGMPLQADPTVQYAAGGPGHWWAVLPRGAATIAPSSSYNTYTHKGLPPGPIASAGLASIQAVLYPAKSSFLYFVAIPKGHGRHSFAATYQEQCQHYVQYGYPACQ